MWNNGLNTGQQETENSSPWERGNTPGDPKIAQPIAWTWWDSGLAPNLWPLLARTLLGIYPRRIEIFHAQTYKTPKQSWALLFIIKWIESYKVLYLIIYNNPITWDNTKMSNAKWLDKQIAEWMMEHSSVTQRGRRNRPMTIWMNLSIVMLNERGQT